MQGHVWPNCVMWEEAGFGSLVRCTQINTSDFWCGFVQEHINILMTEYEMQSAKITHRNVFTPHLINSLYAVLCRTCGQTLSTLAQYFTQHMLMSIVITHPSGHGLVLNKIAMNLLKNQLRMIYAASSSNKNQSHRTGHRPTKYYIRTLTVINGLLNIGSR